MVVLTQFRHPGKNGPVGLHIGDLNVQQYFPRDVSTVELELDHLSIVCQLDPSFWEGQPEIRDFRLSSWLEAKRNSGKLGANPTPIAMIPSGEHSFRVQIMSVEESDKARAENAGLFVTSQTPAAVEAIVPSMNRRKFDAGRAPERRVGRLKRNERPSSSTNN